MCGIRWFYEYGGAKRAETVGWDARLRGASLDAAANAHFAKKLENGVGISRADAIEIGVNAHDEGIDITMFSIPEIVSRDRVAAQVGLWHDVFGQRFSPRSAGSIQTKLSYRDAEMEVPVVGVPDLITTEGIVVDNKIKGKIPKESDVHRDLQLTTYAMMTGATEVALAIITDERVPRVEYIHSLRTPAQVAAVKQRYNLAARSIRSGSLNPAPEGVWYCCAKWCPHWKICPHGDNGGFNDPTIAGLDN